MSWRTETRSTHARAERSAGAAGRNLGSAAGHFTASSPGKLEHVFETILANATLLCEAAFGSMLAWRVQLATVAARHAVPMTSATREIAEPASMPIASSRGAKPRA